MYRIKQNAFVDVNKPEVLSDMELLKHIHNTDESANIVFKDINKIPSLLKLLPIAVPSPRYFVLHDSCISTWLHSKMKLEESFYFKWRRWVKDHKVVVQAHLPFMWGDYEFFNKQVQDGDVETIILIEPQEFTFSVCQKRCFETYEKYSEIVSTIKKCKVVIATTSSNLFVQNKLEEIYGDN